MPGRPTAGCVDLTHAIEVRILVRQPSLCSSLGRASPPYGEGNPFDPGQRLDALLQPEHPDGRMGRAAGPQPRRLPGCRHQDRAHQRPGAAQERDLRAARQHPAPRAPRPTSTGNRTIVSFMRCSELSREPAYCGGSFCLPGSGRADMAVCRVVATRDRAGRQRRHVRGVTIGGDADDIHGHSPGYLPDTGGACGEGAESRLCLTHPMDTSRGAKPGRPGIPGPGLPRQNARPRCSFSPRRSPSPRQSSSPGPGLRPACSPRVAPGFRPRISVPHSTSPPRPGAGNAAAGTCCCQWP